MNAKDLQFNRIRVLHESLIVLLLMYGSEITVLMEKEISRIRTVQISNLGGLSCMIDTICTG